MLSLIIKSYLTILVSVGAFSLFIFFLGLYWIVKTSFRTSEIVQKTNKNQTNNKTNSSKLTSANSVSVKDLESIAGDDKMITLLDLARAYIETGQVSLAKKILAPVLKQGTDQQKKEAQALLMTF